MVPPGTVVNVAPMPVLLIAEVPDLSEPAYVSMLEQLKPALETARGFLFHAGGPSPDGGSRVVEVSAPRGSLKYKIVAIT